MLQSRAVTQEEQSATVELDALEEALGYRFQDRAMLERALTHRSWAHEHVKPGEEEKARHLHNEAYEFIGDAALGLIVADYLHQTHPEASEGELSRMKHRLVSTTTLAKAARRLSLGERLRIGRGEEKTGGRRKRALLADVFEGLLGAIYLDGGFAAAVEFTLRALSPELETADPETAAAADYKTMLQERLQADCHEMPAYQVVETIGPPHKRLFHVEVSWNGHALRGEGRSIKAAEMDAARSALEHLNES